MQLGWRDVDVFGVHPVKPGARVGCWGLVLTIQGGNVIAITDKSATIRRRSGAILIWRRFDVEQVPLWQLVRGAIRMKPADEARFLVLIPLRPGGGNQL